MKNIDIEIYMNNFKSFFEKNPNQLIQLIGNVNPEIFYQGVRDIVEKNSTEEEKPIEPTRQQLIDLIVGLNVVKSSKKKVNYFIEHYMGLICLN